jgi:hypothetical protein
LLCSTALCENNHEERSTIYAATEMKNEIYRQKLEYRRAQIERLRNNQVDETDLLSRYIGQKNKEYRKVLEEKREKNLYDFDIR